MARTKAELMAIAAAAGADVPASATKADPTRPSCACR